jgi:hypothetical protein
MKRTSTKFGFIATIHPHSKSPVSDHPFAAATLFDGYSGNPMNSYDGCVLQGFTVLAGFFLIGVVVCAVTTGNVVAWLFLLGVIISFLKKN